MQRPYADPSFSVVIPLFNKEAYIEAALNSALSQGAWLREAVVVNDGSTDAGPEIVATLARNEPRIILLNQSNSGVSAARNRGIQVAKGDYIVFLDADDLYLPGYFEEISKLIHAFPQAGIYATAYRRFSRLPGLQDERMPGQISRGLIAQPFRSWRKGDFFYTCSVCVPRQAFLAHRIEFPVGERLGEDQDVWFRLAELFPVAYSDRPMVLYRVDVADSLTATGTVKEILPCYARLAVRAEDNFFPPQHRKNALRLVASHYINVARACIQSGDMEHAWQLMSHRRSRRNLYYWLRTMAGLVLRSLKNPRGEHQ